MASQFSDIKDDFTELRHFILNDLGIITNASEGGNYAAALLITTACEALGTLRYGKRDGGADFFKEYLMPGKWQPVVKSIYDALRNGLAHSFVTKVILQPANRPIDLGISWSKEVHFKYDPDRGTLFLNVRQLSKDLYQAFERYETELKSDAKLRDRYLVWRKKQRTCEVKNRTEKEAWKRLIV
jgi:hypothetical protein